MPKHVLPGEDGGDSNWFERMNPFEQQETLRQIRFKRTSWPSLDDGVLTRYPTHSYPHILPVGEIEKAFHEPIAQLVLSYFEVEDIAIHAEILNMRSSQAACMNLLFPLRLNLEMSVTVLAPILPSVVRVTEIEFEYTGPESATVWMGDPPGGRRGEYKTSIDAAIWWEDSELRKRLTFVEFKYTEQALGGCGGYKSKGNRNRQACRSLSVLTEDPRRKCYLSSNHSPNTSRNYWDHLEEAGINLNRLNDAIGCPFIGPFDQLMRQYLLAAYHRHAEFGLDEVDVVVLGFEGNNSLSALPRKLSAFGSDITAAWNSALGEVPPLRMIHTHQLADNIPRNNQDWNNYLNLRYGI